MEYANMKFWLRGYDHRQWSITWMTLFVYFWLCLLYVILKTKSAVNRKLMWYLLGGVNISFILSIIYALIATYYTKHTIPQPCSIMLVDDFAFGWDFPSIWCTSSFVQAPFYFLLLKVFTEQYDVHGKLAVKKISWLTHLSLAALTIGLMYLFLTTMPLFFAVSWRYMAQ